VVSDPHPGSKRFLEYFPERKFEVLGVGAMSSVVSDEYAALVALLQAMPGGLSWPEIAGELIDAGSAIEVWERQAPAPALMDLPEDISPRSAADDIAGWAAQGYRLLSILDEDYPTRLRGIHEAPPVIFTLGTVLADDPAVSVIGSRNASPGGLALAGAVAGALSARGMTVISGLARGIDSAAHRSALDAGGRTVAIIATGIGRTYPAENRGLQREIANRGLVLSQFWPYAPPQKRTFLMRNATMSGYGLATVVIEAGETSGARVQARIAVQHGRQVILTEQVVARNAWAQALIGRPGVYTGSDVDSIMDAVEQIVDTWDELRRLVNS
jgi:DNA processing protein